MKESNCQRNESFFEDFDIEVVRSAEPVENVLHSAKMTIQRVLNETGCTEYMGWIGKGESFRKNISTIKEYKAGKARRPIAQTGSDRV